MIGLIYFKVSFLFNTFVPCSLPPSLHVTCTKTNPQNHYDLQAIQIIVPWEERTGSTHRKKQSHCTNG